MDSITALKNEIQNDPLTRGYSTMTDEALLTSLNAVDRNFNVLIKSNEILSWSGSNERYQKIEDATTNTGLPAAVRNVSKVALKLIDRDGTSFNPSDANHIGMLDALVSAGILSVDDKTSLLAIGAKTGSRVQELGIVNLGDEIYLGHVKGARLLIS